MHCAYHTVPAIQSTNQPIEYIVLSTLPINQSTLDSKHSPRDSFPTLQCKDFKDVVILLNFSDYVASLADEVNEKLQEKGVVDISDMTVVFDLPADFLLDVVAKNLGTRIHGQRDLTNPRVILTDWLIARHRAVLRGSLNASSRPVAIQSLVKLHSLNERLTASR